MWKMENDYSCEPTKRDRDNVLLISLPPSFPSPIIICVRDTNLHGGYQR